VYEVNVKDHKTCDIIRLRYGYLVRWEAPPRSHYLHVEMTLSISNRRGHYPALAEQLRGLLRWTSFRWGRTTSSAYGNDRREA